MTKTPCRACGRPATRQTCDAACARLHAWYRRALASAPEDRARWLRDHWRRWADVRSHAMAARRSGWMSTPEDPDRALRDHLRPRAAAAVARISRRLHPTEEATP